MSDTATKIEENLSLKEPPLYKVVFLNDDVYSNGFCNELLNVYF